MVRDGAHGRTGKTEPQHGHATLTGKMARHDEVFLRALVTVGNS